VEVVGLGLGAEGAVRGSRDGEVGRVAGTVTVSPQRSPALGGQMEEKSVAFIHLPCATY
jgi:hypothetical protein